MSAVIDISTRFDRATAAPAMHARAELIAQPRLRITRRGRSVLSALIATPVIVVALVIAANSGGAVATADGSSVPLETLTVQPGDSLWQIAEEYAPQSDPRDFIADVTALNGTSAAITAGQTLEIPAQYSN